MRQEEYTFTRPIPLDQMEEMAKQLASACHEKTCLEEQKKASASEYKGKIDRLSTDISEISDKINDGYEEVTELCDVEFDYENRMKRYFLGGEKIGELPMSSADMQLTLNDPTNS